MLALSRLGGQEGAVLVERLAGNDGLTRETVDEIVERADGVPLFVEELTKAVLESGDRAPVLAGSPSSALAIPATLHASLIARLDRLGPIAKEVAQVGSVIGREFGDDLGERVAQRPAAELRSALDRLTEAGLLFCRGVPPSPIYSSTHWCRTPPTALCCERDDWICTPASRLHLSGISRILSSASPSSWRII